jgi:hypothetical protein
MTKSTFRISPLITMVVVLASLGVILLTLQAAREIISPVILALVLAALAMETIVNSMGELFQEVIDQLQI